MNNPGTVAAGVRSAQDTLGDSQILNAAFDCAREAHALQTRKDGGPFIGHPVAVAGVLESAGFDEEVCAAALLHDVVEDSEVELAEIERRFGERVAGLVEAMTEDPAVADYEARKGSQRAQVEAAGAEAVAIYAADKLVNVRELRRLYAREGERAARLYKVALDDRIRIWRADLEMAAANAPELPHVRELRYELESLEEQRAARA